MEKIPTVLVPFFSQYLGRGTIATALFVLVMYAAVMPKGTRFHKTLIGTRRDVAITAAILILIHNISFGKYFFVALFTAPGQLQTYQKVAAIISLIMLALLIPLTVTSFVSVRRKMNPLTWKKIQQLSYWFYGFMYVHVAILFGAKVVKGDNSYLIELAIYTIIFGIYAILRIRKYLQKR